PTPRTPRTDRAPSRQPPLAPLVVLHVAIRLPRPDLRQAEIELLDVGITAERLAAALQYDPAVLHHVAVVGDGEGQRRVLLDQEHRQLLLAVEPPHDLEDLLDEHGREPE